MVLAIASAMNDTQWHGASLNDVHGEYKLVHRYVIIIVVLMRIVFKATPDDKA